MKKKILIVQGILPHYRKDVFNLLSEKYDVTVLHSGQVTASLSDRYTEILAPTKKIWKFRLQSYVLRNVYNRKFDAIILMFDLWWVLSLIPLIIPKPIPIILWGHRYNNNKLINWLRDVFLKFSDAILLYTQEDVVNMLSRGINKRKIFVANNTINVKNYSDTSNCKKNSFIYVGRLQKRKCINQLIGSFASVLTNLPSNIRIDIIGEGPERQELQRIAIENGVSDRVFFYGTLVDDEKLKQLFSSAFAYVSPGHVGLGVLHSFAYGVPVITMKHSNHAQEYYNLKHNINSLIVNDDEELSQCLLKISENNSLTSRLGKEAYFEYKDNCNIQNMVSGFHNALFQVFQMKLNKNDNNET